MRVRAKALGYYNLIRRKPGVEFDLLDREHYSKLWMEPVGWAPDRPAKPADDKAKPKGETKPADDKAKPKGETKPADDKAAA